MHRATYGSCQVQLVLTATSELLVQSGQPTQQQQGGPRSTPFFQAYNPQTDRRENCLPATSLKGVLRSTSERILRSFDADLACDPFGERSCSKRNERSSEHNDIQYKYICPVCRLFGCTAHAGLVTLDDAWPRNQGDTTNRQAKRTHVAIDRLLGGAAPGMLYSYEAQADDSVFVTHMAIHNFELWQIGLLALACREIDSGFARLGWGTRRGLGKISCKLTDMRFRYSCAAYERAPGGQRSGICSATFLAQSGALPGPTADRDWLLPNITATTQKGNWRTQNQREFVLADADQQTLLAQCVEQSLKPRLLRGCAGFDYQPPTAEDNDADQ